MVPPSPQLHFWLDPPPLRPAGALQGLASETHAERLNNDVRALREVRPPPPTLSITTPKRDDLPMQTPGNNTAGHTQCFSKRPCCKLGWRIFTELLSQA